MTKKKQKYNSEIIKKFFKDFDIADTAENDSRTEMIEDLEFAALKQWTDSQLKDRAGRPCLTLDHVGQPIRKILGGMRRNMPQIKYEPLDSGADVDAAEVMTDLVRQIQQASSAKDVYMTAAGTQVKCGYGVFRIVTVENQDDIFKQDISMMPEPNPFVWYFDPDAVLKQKQDGSFAIKIVSMSIDAFKERYGDDVPTSLPTMGEGQMYDRWYDGESIVVGEYYKKVKVDKTIVQLNNGQVVDFDELSEEDVEQYRQQGIQPVNSRKVKVDKIKYYKLTAFDVIEEQDWPSKYFPAIPVYGEVENIEGKTVIRGVVRAAKDPQKMYNYWNSAAAETISLQPKAPWLVTQKQIKKYAKYWNRAHIDNLPFLPYDVDEQAPPPQRSAPPALQAGLLQQAGVSASDIQQATGVFEASVGALPQQRSGIAVEALQAEADLGTSLYADNMESAIQHAGKVILDLIPVYYDTQRIVKIRGEDDVTKFVEINKPILTPDGLRIQNDLTRGKYDVIANIGPSFKTRRKEAASSMVELGRIFPQIMQVAGDLVAKNLDWPGADEIAERLKKLLPPGIVEDQEEMTPEQQAAIQQQNQLQQAQLQIEMADKQAEIENTQADTAKKISEAQQNEIENAVQIAELAAQQQNQQLMANALQNVIALIRNDDQNLQLDVKL